MQFIGHFAGLLSINFRKAVKLSARYSKIIRIMKLTCFFLTCCFLQVSGGTLGQNVNISVKNTSLKKVFRIVAEQTGYALLADGDLLKKTSPVTLDLKNVPLEEALEICFKDQPVTFFIAEEIVSLKEKPGSSPALSEDDSEENFLAAEIRGRVTNESGEAVPGVSVMIKGQSKGTTTNENGEFVLLADVMDELEFSIIGYKTVSVQVKDSNAAINIVLAVDAAEQSEIVVVGFGTQKRSNLTGAVSELKGKDIENRMTPNVTNALQGLIPNLNVSINNRGGEPGANPDFNIRGIGSLSGGSPFILVDGIPQDLNSVNPNDIASISVLKDASASAIYGVRAAYGVILITTKKGIAGAKPRISYSGNAAWQTPTKLPDIVSSVEWAETANEGYANAGLPPYFSSEAITKMKQNIANPGSVPTVDPNPSAPNLWLFPPYGNMDAYDEFFKPFAFNHQHNLSLSGGSERFTYFLSGGLFDQGPQYRFGNENFQRYTITANISSQVTDWLRLSLNSRYIRRKIDMPHVYPNIGDFYHDIPRRWPMFPVYDPNGHFFVNTFALVANGGRNITEENQLLNSAGFEIEPLKNWKINADINIRQNFNSRSDHEKIVYMYGPDEIPYPDWTATRNGYLSSSYRNYFNSNNIYTTYEHNIERNYFKIMAGLQSELNQDELFSVNRNQLITDNIPFITTATGQPLVGGNKGHWATLGYFARFNYNFDEKILFEFSSRYDGTSRFQEGRRWGFFPSFSAGYNIAKEGFWGGLADKVSMLKFRVSYGTLGNQAVSANYYPYLAGLGINTNLNWVMGTERPVFITAPGLVSPDITWETATTLNFGLDAEALSNRLSLSFDVYNRVTDNMFGPSESLPNVLGAAAPLRNNASLSTKGFELSLGWRDRVGNIDYRARLLLSDNISTVKKYRNLSGTLTDHYVGKQLGEIWGLTTAGIYQTPQEVAAGPDQSFYHANWVPGDVQYTDLNKDGKVNGNTATSTLSNPGDLSIIGNSTPRYSFGLNLGVEWKGFYLDMLWQGVAKRDLWLNGNFFWGVVGDINQTTIFEEHLDYWSPDNTSAYYPRPIMISESGKNRQAQTRYLQNASYLRLKNLQLGYTLPAAISGRFGMGTLRLYFTGENLLTFTKLLGVFDPEATGGAWGQGKLYPLAKVYSIGINMNLK